MLQRYSALQRGVTIGTTPAASQSFDFRNFSAGMVHVPAGSALTTLTWYAACDVGEPFLPVQNGLGVAVTSTVSAGMACLIPAACFGAAILLAVGDAAGTVDLSLKG